MTLRQIQSAVRTLKVEEQIELYRWLDYEMATDFCSGDWCSRIGVGRAQEIRDQGPARVIQDLQSSVRSVVYPFSTVFG
jgi:hypothetical protein